MREKIGEFVGAVMTAGATPPVGGRVTPQRPGQPTKGAPYVYDADLPPDELFGRFAATLSRTGDLYRHPDNARRRH